jgi:alkylhydroperoxidase/carboxymuconolactone decarboxylase family protein YurZ
VREIYEHFRKTIGEVPKPFLVMGENNPVFLDAYYRMRNHVYNGPLGKKVTELIIIAIDVIFGAPPEYTALHIKSAMRAGATKREISDAILLAFMIPSANRFARFGYLAMQSAAEFEKEQKAQGSRKRPKTKGSFNRT